MANCPTYVSRISPAENLGDSLYKINNNFYNLRTELCDLKQRLDGTVAVRTFFYYGPNAANNATANMQNNISSRPSNNTIENFVNNPSELNLPSISKTNDQAYVIYQKTGFYANQITRLTPWSATARVISFSTVVTGNAETPDRYNTYSLAFIIWLLTYNGARYVVEKDFPKFSQAETISSPNWNNPLLWREY